MNPIIQISSLKKFYAGGFQALNNIHLNINQGEIFALLGPNGAGKTTLIGAICGIVQPSEGVILADGFNVVTQARQARQKIGLVPQELCTDSFESVWSAVSFSRGLFGKPANPQLIEQLLKQLSLWDKKDSRIMDLSGGMKRRVMIAKALSHEPEILFLDEPSAGVDVELRKDMWLLIRRLRESGCTIILTTHYIEEAEEMADRVGVINQGEIILVEDKLTLMKKMGKRTLLLSISNAINSLPEKLKNLGVEFDTTTQEMRYTFDQNKEHLNVAEFLKLLAELGIEYNDLHASQSSLEEIFVNLLGDHRA